MREISTGLEYNTHHDRISNPLFSGKTNKPEPEAEHEPNANPEENLKEPEDDSEPVGDAEEAFMRTRSGRVVRPRRNKDFDYAFVLFQHGFKQTSTKTCISDYSYSSTSAHSFSNDDSFHESLSIVTDSAHAPLRGHANPGTMPLMQDSMMRCGQRIHRELCLRLANLGEKVCWVTDDEGVQQQMAMLKGNGTLFKLDVMIGDWLKLGDGSSFTEIEESPTWPF